jgi:23S rRNA pseudouridine1911/1915/1917 synthase
MQKKNKILSLPAGEFDIDSRLDSFIVRKLPKYSRSYIQKLIENKSVLVNSVAAAKNYRIRPNDTVEIPDVDALLQPEELLPLKKKLKIIHEDSYLVAISKEAGMSVHPAAGNSTGTLANAIVFYLQEKQKAFGKTIRPGIVHRLDKDTSGIILVAKDPATQSRLSLLFKERRIIKIYSVLVVGDFSEESGQIDLPIGRSRIDRKKMGISIDYGRQSLTDFKVIERFGDCTLIDAYPKTGRTHQIRVHLSYINHSVIGDTVYGNSQSTAIAKKIGLKRQFLHARYLSFIHPVTGKAIELQDDLAPDLDKSLGILRANKI